MSISNSRILRLIGIALLSGLVVFNTYTTIVQKPVVYVDIGKLVDGYKLKTDLEEQAAANLLRIRNVIDSLQLVHSLKSGPAIDSNIVRLQAEFDRYYKQSNDEMTREVWDRLNPAIEKFGIQNRYRVIVGANGTGSVLYGDEEADITEELINYVNLAYEKGI
jgi:outer membrane protein